jgi:hypothetical protein
VWLMRSTVCSTAVLNSSAVHTRPIASVRIAHSTLVSARSHPMMATAMVGPR